MEYQIFNTPKNGNGHPNLAEAAFGARLGAERRELAENVTLIVEPGLIQSPEEFEASARPRSVALDDRVACQTYWNPSVQKGCFNHHVNVDRLATQSTERQVFDALLHDHFAERLLNIEGRYEVTALAKEPDLDVAFATTFLKRHDWFARYGTAAIAPLVDREDHIDRRCGFFACKPNDPLIRKLAWVGEPYEEWRKAGGRGTAREMADLIEAVGFRLEQVWTGAVNGVGRALDTRYQRIGGGDGWLLIQEDGFYARIGLANADLRGLEGAVSVRRFGPERWSYAVMKTHNYSSFPVAALFKVLNAAELIPDNAPYRWGGSNFGGGSPYNIGSTLEPSALQRVINGFCRFLAKRPATEALTYQFIIERLPELAIRRLPTGSLD